MYHGRIILPPQYPLRPPNFRFLTPTGRFEVNREICLSISGHHEETWQPAWGVRTALVAIRSFMDTDAKGQLGGIECTKDARERMARESGKWQCPGCGKSNADIIKEREAAVGHVQGAPHQEEQLPEELRLAYRDELGTQSDTAQTLTDDKAKASAVAAEAEASTSAPRPRAPATQPAPPPRAAAPRPAPTTQAAPLHEQHDPVILMLNIAIGSIVALLLYMTLRKFQ